MHLEDDDKILVRRALLELESRLKAQAEELKIEEEMLVHVTGSDRTTKVHQEVLKSETTLKRLMRLRSLFSVPDVDIVLLNIED